MRIFHESTPEEAEFISNELYKAYKINNEIINVDLGDFFVPSPSFAGFKFDYDKFTKSPKFSWNKKCLILTQRDLYAQFNSQEDDWVFGCCYYGAFMTASGARMKGNGNAPLNHLEVPKEKYLARLSALSIHEVGHGAVNARHFQEATWVNAKTGYKLPLGPHCTDNRCVMYEIIDIRAPQKAEGFMQLGSVIKTDAGLDEVLDRIYPNLFCDKCKTSISVDESYF